MSGRREALSVRTAEIVASLRASDGDGGLAEDALPLSFAQHRLWFLDQLEPGSAAYNLGVSKRLRGPLDVAALTDALTDLARRHQSLRATFPSKNGEPVQHISNVAAVTLEVIDLTPVPPGERSAAAWRTKHERVARPIDLAQGPLFRPLLVALGPEDHELLMIVHHVVADGWSLGILVRELAVLYEARLAGRSSPLPELPIQYADFVRWQRQRLAGDVLETQRRYWRERLAGLPAPFHLPTDHPRPSRPTSAAGHHDFVVPRSLAEGLRQLSRREGVTLFMTLMAAFNVLLARYGAGEDIVVGTPAANRDHVELEPVVGLFANTLVLRTDLGGDPTFRELLTRVRETCLGAYAHADMPFEKIVEDLQPERALGLNPLFEVSFVWQGAPADRDLTFFNVASAFDVSLFVTGAVDGTLTGSVQYRRDLFEPATIGRLVDHYRELLESVMADPDRALSKLPLLGEAEARLVMVEWNATAAHYPRDRSVHGQFEDQVDTTPDAVALEFEETSLTYRELDRRANQLAHYLRALGVGPERLVGLRIDRSPEMIVALLGILKAGGAYAPLDMKAPPERIGFMLRDAGIDIVLTREPFLESAPARVISLEAHGPSIGAQPDVRPPDSNAAESLAYVMYTSGSTGEPKGVAVTHRNITRLVKGTDYARFGPDEVFLQLAPLSFDLSTFEIWGALLNGGRVAMAPPGALAVDELGTILQRHGVTTLWLTAGLFHQIVDHRISILRPLRQLLAGGDVLSVPHVRRVLEELPACRLINGYGPTEGTTFSCCYAIPGDARLERSVPIGRPIANTRVYVLDRNLRLVPIGVPGELCIAGDGVARGYINRTALTAERFVVHRVSETLEERLYRSGDVVRWLADGTLEFLGRRDDQVKIRGYRVEPGEIEATLARHPHVRDVAVVVRSESGDDKHLVAYVVVDGALTPGDLRDFLRRKVPEYMVPALFIPLDHLPLTENGKLDRRALPEPASNGESVPTSSHDELESKLVRVWRELLPVKSVGIRDNFFELGGHSLLAVRLIARIQDCLHVRLPLSALFQTPTIEGLAATIRAGGQLVSPRSLVALEARGSRPPVFAVPGVGGSVHCYLELARLVTAEQPFYALQSRGLDVTEEPLTRIEDIATAFLHEIREIQPKGPYMLMGVCMGGVVAYEMAQQLRLAGETVGALVLLETWLPVPGSGRLARADARKIALLNLFASRLRLYAQTLARLRGRQRVDYVLGRLRMFGEMISQRDVFRGDRSELSLRVVTHANLSALRRYTPRVYPGRVVLFRAEGRQVAALDDRRLAWRHLVAGDSEVHTVPGNDSGHMLTEPYVRVLARALNACLERAQPSVAPGQRA